MITHDSDAYAMQQAAQQGIAVQGLSEVMAGLRRQALDVGYPPPETVKRRIPLITRWLNERHLARYIRANVQALALIMLHETGRIDLMALKEAYIDYYPQGLVSLGGKGRKELVEMSRWVQPVPPRRGLLSFLTR